MCFIAVNQGVVSHSTLVFLDRKCNRRCCVNTLFTLWIMERALTSILLHYIVYLPLLIFILLKWVRGFYLSYQNNSHPYKQILDPDLSFPFKEYPSQCFPSQTHALNQNCDSSPWACMPRITTLATSGDSVSRMRTFFHFNASAMKPATQGSVPS